MTNLNVLNLSVRGTENGMEIGELQGTVWVEYKKFLLVMPADYLGLLNILGS